MCELLSIVLAVVDVDSVGGKLAVVEDQAEFKDCAINLLVVVWIILMVKVCLLVTISF